MNWQEITTYTVLAVSVIFAVLKLRRHLSGKQSCSSKCSGCSGNCK
ncbi:MAG: FeoB-associated Cys-rich membrane protein [Bacteroidales bacterium]|nr:FeoB-associated Cys-rich membrane protein [Bacteroidales bacterium]